VISLGEWEVGAYLQPRSRGKGWPSNDKFKGEGQEALSFLASTEKEQKNNRQFAAQACFPLS